MIPDRGHRMTAKSVQIVATLPQVREVSIVGTATYGFWADHLGVQNLTPLKVDGRAQILLMATDARFKGIRFQELSVSISLAPGDRPGQQLGAGAYLARAFNSSRLFAFCERKLFRTPYFYGPVEVRASLPASVRLTRKREPLFRAEMGTGGAPESPGVSPYEQGWEGPVFLPSGRLFFARIRGAAQVVAFRPSRDALEIRPPKKLLVLQALLDSEFTATHWLVRPDAVHQKSKTYEVSEAGGLSWQP